MAYNPATDNVALWRNNGGNVSKEQMPGLDFVIAALARAGVIVLTVSATAPVANQSTTAWLQTDVPSWSGEGAFQLWNKLTTAYAAATPRLFLEFLEASAGQTGASWFQTVGGPPANIIGNDGDFAIRTDNPGGIYGPKAGGVWPGTPIPGTTATVDSTSLDNTFGTAVGSVIYRGVGGWVALPIGSLEDMVMTRNGGLPAWQELSTVIDAVLGGVWGSVLYRDGGGWHALAPSTANFVLTTNGPNASPSWTSKSSEFGSGTSLVFQQSAAPLGWTKQTALDDYGLRVTNGAVGVHAGTPFSTVFAQTQVGNTTLTVTQMPSHVHSVNANTNNTSSSTGGGGFQIPAPTATVQTASAGGDGPHTHSVNLTLSYLDVIIATKD